MALDLNNELEQALDLHAQAGGDLRTASDTLHLAGIHLTNVQSMLAKQAQPRPELAAYLVDNASYTTTLTARLKTYLDKIAASQIRRVIVWQNKQQLAAGFMQQALDRGLQWDLDTVYKLRTLTTDFEFAKCIEQAEAMQVSAYRFDDAHNQTPEALAIVVAFMRKFTDKPVIGSFGALDERTVTDPKTGVKTKQPIDMQAYKDAGLQIARQFYRHEQVTQTPKNPTQVISTWLESGRITDGVDLEAYAEGAITTSASDFDSMLLRCLSGGIREFTIYAVVNEAGWQMWTKAPELWQAVQRAAVTLRTLK